MEAIFAAALAYIFYAAFVAAYLYARPPGVLSVLDFFFLFFNLQFGPHAILPHSLRELGVLVPEAYPNYATGLAVCYAGLAISIAGLGLLTGSNRLRMTDRGPPDLTPAAIPMLLAATGLYLMIFLALQGFSLTKTISYLNFFRGDSLYTYNQLRREMFLDDAGNDLAALTRQSLSALLFAANVYASLRFPRYRILGISLASAIFVICALQMNKFPTLYYTLIVGLVFYLKNCFDTRRFFRRRYILYLAFGILVFAASLYTLYTIQYGAGLEAGVVDEERIWFRVLYRPLVANHDVLWLWFAHFPETFDFVGFSNIAPIARAFGLEHFRATVEIPALYSRGVTSFQAGFIGSGYASFGYAGVLVCALGVGCVVVGLVHFQNSIRSNWQSVVYLSVGGMNMYFLSSRELQTALLSGGILLTPVLVMILGRLLSGSGGRTTKGMRPRGDATHDAAL